MDVRIGVIYTGKELEVELPDETNRDEISKLIDAAVSGTNPVLWLTDRKGKTVGVPSDRIAYVELGRSNADRKVGFGA
ncbi:MAG TPA: DUF3107 domain-containing protein [Acidimicrobiales bacterium]|nr:DUF3107 domain-containing protein [Acidimicrobiales bacterium]